jgi:hypothetical protein
MRGSTALGSDSNDPMVTLELLPEAKVLPVSASRYVWATDGLLRRRDVRLERAGDVIACHYDQS